MDLCKLGEPRVVQDFLKLRAFVSALLQKLYINIIVMLTLTLADIFALLRDLLPRVESEIGRLVNGLARNLTVVFIIKGKHSTQQ